MPVPVLSSVGMWVSALKWLKSSAAKTPLPEASECVTFLRLTRHASNTPVGMQGDGASVPFFGILCSNCWLKAWNFVMQKVERVPTTVEVALFS